MDEIRAQFDAIMKDNDMKDWSEPLSLEELVIVLASVSNALTHMTCLLVDSMDAEDEENLPIEEETSKLLRSLFQSSETFLDKVVEEMFEENEEECNDDEDEF